MTKLISFQTYQTEYINVLGNEYTLRFSHSQDKTEYTLFVSNNTKNQESKYSHSKEVADNFRHYESQELTDEVTKIIRADIEKGII